MRNRPLRLALAAALLLAACDSDSSPTAPGPAPGPSTWAGMLEIVAIPQGDDTCFTEQVLTARSAPVEVELPTPSSSGALGSATALDLGVHCANYVRQSGGAVTWNPYKCGAPCVWGAFTCGGRQRWTYCVGYGEFAGAMVGDALTGEQPMRFSVFDGRSQYAVEARLRYTLTRR